MAIKPTTPSVVLSIKDYVEDTNLLTINWQYETLKRIANEYNLRPWECVVFENVTRDKARIVAHMGLLVLIIPPIDKLRQLSVHLEVNMFIRELGTTVKLRKSLDDRVQAIVERLARRKELAALMTQQRKELLKNAVKKIQKKAPKKSGGNA